MKKKRIQFYIDIEDYEFLVKYAKECRRTVPNLAIHALMQHLKRYAHYTEKQWQNDKLIEKEEKTFARTGIPPHRGINQSMVDEIEYLSNPILTENCLNWFVHNLISKDEEYIYFAKIKNKEIIKIGYSINPKKRIIDMNTAMPLDIEILAVIKGSRKTEKWLHKLLQKYNIKGEWFEYNDSVKQIIKKIDGIKINLQ